VHIADSLLHLQRAGNPQYTDWSRSYACDAVGGKELEDLNQFMKKELQDWLANVSSLRKRLYALNYFTCLQLLKISREFYHLINNLGYQMNSEVFLLLMSISPDLTIEHVKKVMSSTEAQTIALKSFNAPLPSAQDDSFCIIDEVDVEVEKLSEEEKEIFTTATAQYMYNPRLVIAALRHSDCDEDAVIEWCMDNNKMYEEKPIADNSSIIEQKKIEIDASNSVVKELIDMDFSETLAIEAVKICGEDIEKCIDHCSTKILDKSFSESIDGAPNENLLIKADAVSNDATDSYLSRYVH